MSAGRYEIQILIGPCRESEAESLTLELADYLRGKHGELGSELGAALAVGPFTDSEPVATPSVDRPGPEGAPE